jgi:photosystem II stability/assembly factor-like uncharacterized protein
MSQGCACFPMACRPTPRGRSLRRAVLTAAAALSALAPLHAGTNRWTSIGPNGGPVTAVLLDPANPGVVYAGSYWAGVFKSIDGGGTWRPANRGLHDFSVSGLAADPHHPGTLYATTNITLSVSHDAAATWTPLPLRVPEGGLTSVVVDPVLPHHLYVGTTITVWASRDGGNHWTASKGFRCGPVNLVADAVRGKVYAVSPDCDRFRTRLAESGDGGATWRDLSANLPDVGGGASLAVEPVAPGTLWLANLGVTFRSSDGGASWQHEPGGAPVAAGAGGLVVSGTFRSLDGGGTWQAGGAFPDLAIAIAISPDQSRIYAGGANVGMMVSGDAAQSWQIANQGLVADVDVTVAVDPRDSATLYTAVVGEGLLKSTSGGAEWQPIGPHFDVEELVTTVVLDPAAPSTLYFVDPNGGPVSRSTDGGATWTQLPVPASECFRVSALIPDPGSPSVLYGIGALGGPSDCKSSEPSCTAFKSVDGGESWSCLGSPGPPNPSFIVVAPSRPSTLYGFGQFGPGGSLLWRSVDGGASWTSIAAGLPHLGYAYNYSLSQIMAVDPTNAQRIFIGVVNGGVWRSVDGGQHWQRADRGLPHGAPYPPLLAVDPQNPQLVYAAKTEIGVYYSLNGGGTWRPILGGLPPVNTGPLYTALKADPQRSGTVYLSTWGFGVMAYSAR